jgi:Xaa-Pro aminopeptidase
MGAIDLSMAIFPKGTTDAAVDLAARQHLFNVGLNYRHGTGHGIGMFLGVHEGKIPFPFKTLWTNLPIIKFTYPDYCSQTNFELINI